MGHLSKGREDIEQRFQGLLTGPLQGAKFEGEIENIRFLTPTVALIDLTAEITPIQGLPRKLRSIAVFVNRMDSGSQRLVEVGSRQQCRCRAALCNCEPKLRRSCPPEGGNDAGTDATDVFRRGGCDRLASRPWRTAHAPSGNSEVGTWKLNVANSKSSPGTALKSGTVKNEAVGAGIKSTVDAVDAAGTVGHYEFTANYDGKDYPVTGNSPLGDMGCSHAYQRNLNNAGLQEGLENNGHPDHCCVQ